MWDRKCVFNECNGCDECRNFRFPSAPPSIPLRLTADTTDLEPFFATFGVAAPPLLDVAFTRQDVLLGDTSRYARMASDKLGGDMHIFWKAPSITWDAKHVPRGLVMMMDLDAGGRASADGAVPGSLGPYVQALWSGCTGGSVTNCHPLLRYEPPDVRQGTDRIVFVLFHQPAAVWVRGVSMRPFVLNMSDFLLANYPPDDRAVVAYNFFYLSGSEGESELNPRRFPPWETPPPPPPKPPPYRTPDSPHPPPSPKPPVYTWWNGTETKPPWEREHRQID